jgi:flagellar hook-associated protein 3 FlgL
MRITTETQSQQSILNLQLTYARMAKLQNQISSGKRLQSSSDDPIGMVQILQNNTQSAELDTSLKNIQTATSTLQASVDAMTRARDVLTSAINTANNANTVTSEPGTASTLSSQIDSALNQLLTIANSQSANGTYLFSGTSSTTQPFAVTGTNTRGQTAGIVYNGSQQNSATIVGKSLTVPTLISGSSVFQTNSRQASVYSGSTGAKAGTGTDSATGQGTLLVQHTVTTYAGASGVSAGTSSPANDTILGPSGANTLTISDTSGNGSSGTVSLNGGPAVAYSNADTDLKVTGPGGEIVSVNTQSIAHGFNGTVNLTSDGTISSDGGTTTTPIDFSTNQVITNGATGAVTNVDSSAIRKAGTNEVDYQGTFDVFQTLVAIRDTIKNSQGLNATDRSARLTRQIAELDRLNTAITIPLGQQAVQSQFISNLQDRTTNLQTNLAEATSNLQSTDMATAIVDLQQQQNLYQAGLQITAKINTLTLADFIH